MLHQEHRPVPPLPDGFDQRNNGGHLFERHPGRRLVEQEDFRVQREQDAHLELALLAVGQLARGRAPFGSEEHGLEDLPRAVL